MATACADMKNIHSFSKKLKNKVNDSANCKYNNKNLKMATRKNKYTKEKIRQDQRDQRDRELLEYVSGFIASGNMKLLMTYGYGYLFKDTLEKCKKKLKEIKENNFVNKQEEIMNATREYLTNMVVQISYAENLETINNTRNTNKKVKMTGKNENLISRIKKIVVKCFVNHKIFECSLSGSILLHELLKERNIKTEIKMGFVLNSFRNIVKKKEAIRHIWLVFKGLTKDVAYDIGYDVVLKFHCDKLGYNIDKCKQLIEQEIDRKLFLTHGKEYIRIDLANDDLKYNDMILQEAYKLYIRDPKLYWKCEANNEIKKIRQEIRQLVNKI